MHVLLGAAAFVAVVVAPTVSSTLASHLPQFGGCVASVGWIAICREVRWPIGHDLFTDFLAPSLCWYSCCAVGVRYQCGLYSLAALRCKYAQFGGGVWLQMSASYAWRLELGFQYFGFTELAVRDSFAGLQCFCYFYPAAFKTLLAIFVGGFLVLWPGSRICSVFN